MNQHRERASKSYTVTSPYMELLESKKKVFGLKYQSSFGGNASHSKSTHQNSGTSAHPQGSNKGRPASSSGHYSKSGVKSNSSEKVKSSKAHGKKKRVYTEQQDHDFSSDPKMHESLFVNMDASNSAQGKPLFYNPKQSYVNNFEFLKKFSEFNSQLKQKHNPNSNANNSASKSQKSNKSTKSKPKPRNSHQKGPNFEGIHLGKSAEQLSLVEIEELICLIDNCVEEANDYIAFLSSKVDSLKAELMKSKAEECELERIIKEKNQELERKDQQIISLKRRYEDQRTPTGSQQEPKSPSDMKKMLDVLNEMNEQNIFLQSKVKNLEEELFKKEPKGKGYDSFKPKERRNSSKDVYNEIHSKIDILNISIDNNHKFPKGGENHEADHRQSESKKFKLMKSKHGFK